jgi:hypothetical protein
MEVTVEGIAAVPTQVPPSDTTLLVIVNDPPPVHSSVPAHAGDAGAPTTKAATAATEQATTTVRDILDTRIPDGPTVGDGALDTQFGLHDIWSG